MTVVFSHVNKLKCYHFFAAQLLGFRNNIPPFARTRGRAILNGLNFASGAAGIRDETGNNLVNLLSFVFTKNIVLSLISS